MKTLPRSREYRVYDTLKVGGDPKWIRALSASLAIIQRQNDEEKDSKKRWPITTQASHYSIGNWIEISIGDYCIRGHKSDCIREV